MVGERMDDEMILETIDFPDLDTAIDADAWDYLRRENEFYARAVEREVRRGRTPEQIRERFVQRTHGLRPEMAARIEQAARHLKAQEAS